MVKVRVHKKYVKKNSRHIRWNYQKSPDSPEMMRYHFIVVDDKNRKGKIEEILNYAQEKSIIGCTFEEIRSVEGKVKGTKYRYLFQTYDTKYVSSFLNPKNLFKNVLKDKQLYERERTSIEDYVAGIYE